MKKIIFTLFISCLGMLAYAQQDAQYTQFMFNKLAYNAGYAGSGETACISCLYRNQWVGFRGAPQTAVLNFDTPLFKNKVGVGMNVVYDLIGVEQRLKASLVYAYRLKLGEEGSLGIGVRATLWNYRVKFSELEATQLNDTEIPTGNPNSFAPNFGIGVYYSNEKFYVGVSVPHLLETDLDFGDNGASATTEVLSNLDRHYFIMGGVIIRISEKVQFHPNLLVKYVPKSPFDMDVNANFVFFKKLWIGATYRLGGSTEKGFGESIDAVLQYQINPQFKLGLAYDYTLSDLTNYNQGSYEAMVHYCFNYKDRKLTNPRFF